jgi:DNA topoisomerase VI subunit B
MPTVQEEIKEAIDQIGRTFEEFKTENNKQIAKGVKDAIAEAKLDKLNQAIDDLTGKKEDL